MKTQVLALRKPEEAPELQREGSPRPRQRKGQPYHTWAPAWDLVGHLNVCHCRSYATGSSFHGTGKRPVTSAGHPHPAEG